MKPRLYRQNPDGARVEEWAVKITVKITFFSSVRGGGHRLYRRGFNRRLHLEAIA
ncbi:hypothetical protein K4039_07690 [Lyngbya sp. CCAP 1446/10]|uniref:hypothetical protein n=1 Tax=Microcoleaceae TaxID=1892252 RepID=UPI002239144C|nr:hypothetical protein [Lyngbya sp. CCAP 1446/10]MCW6049967.1 hypothetical protein [Lyngbya sp. CCAP 1446/10]